MAEALAPKADCPNAGLAPKADGVAGVEEAGEPNAVAPNADVAGTAAAGVVAGWPKAEVPKAGLFTPGVPKLLEPNAGVAAAALVALAKGFAPPNPEDTLGIVAAPPNPKDGFAAAVPVAKGDPAADANGDGAGGFATCTSRAAVKRS